MTEIPEHPIEAVHLARDALEHAALSQARSPDPAAQEFQAYGSAVVSTLTALGQLTVVLADQVDQYDEQHLPEESAEPQPVQRLHHAVRHLVELRDVLAIAVTDAHRYWHAIEDVHTAEDVHDAAHQV
jgi:hypothetical protein